MMMSYEQQKDILKKNIKNKYIFWILYLIIYFSNIIMSFILGFFLLLIEQRYLCPLLIIAEIILFLLNYKFLGWLLNKKYRWLRIVISSIPQLAFFLNFYIVNLLRDF